MKCILTGANDIYFNLAAEEYLLKNSHNNYFMLWQSRPCVVVGKHQNAMAEINYSFLKANDIPVARRLTGGGTVYHDPGNLNFTFIMNGEKGKLVNFGRYLTPIVEFLHSKNILARPGTKNEINVNGLKISGNAEHVYKNRVLHHGTLLYDSNLEFLQKSIEVKSGEFIDKAVQSNRADVINISSFLENDYSQRKFLLEMFEFIKGYFNESVDYTLDDSEKAEIEKLKMNKYETWEWIFGYSPAFEIKKTITLRNHTIKAGIKVQNGIIEKAVFESSSLRDLAMRLSGKLTGMRFDYDDIESCMTDEIVISDEMSKSILSGLF